MTASSRRPSNRSLAERRIDIINRGRFDELEQIFDADYVQTLPQSGEVLCGLDNLRATLEHYPGAEQGFAPREMAGGLVVEPQPRDIVAPSFTMSAMPGYHLIHIEDQGDTFTSYATARYPDGSDWYVVSITTVRNGKIMSETQFYAPRFDPPAWRAQWVDHILR